MILRFNIIRNVTQFDSVQPDADANFKRLTLVYAENGRGKTSLSSIFRSLSTGISTSIQERSRLGSTHLPHIVIACDTPTGTHVFENNRWNHAYPTLSIFDDVFIFDNVYSGLEVGPNHRQNLHEFILGSRGVILARRVDELATNISEINSNIQRASISIPVNIRGQLTVDQFCALTARVDINQEIEDVQRQIDALSHAPEIARTALFSEFSLPQFDIENIRAILSSSLENIDQTALTRVSQHFTQIGARGEQWIADGLQRVIPPANNTDSSKCPFCAQDISGSAIVTHYRSYFSAEYATLKRSITDAANMIATILGGDSLASFLRQIQDVRTNAAFWRQFCTIPEFNIDLQSVQTTWQQSREFLLNTLESKRLAPLDGIDLPEDAFLSLENYISHFTAISTLNTEFQNANDSIRQLKQDVSNANLNTLTSQMALLRTTQTRFLPEVSILCDNYLALKEEKRRAEEAKTEARRQLDEYRDRAFPNFQTAINDYLRRFNADFEIVNVQPSNAAGRPSSAYHIRINNTNVNVNAPLGQQAFRNTLSGGDRNSLALAFFFASLDQEPDLNERIVVLDDVVASLDEHRKLVTAEEVRRLLTRVSQVIVLSHNKSFLCEIWNHLHDDEVSTLQIVRATVGSNITTWDPSIDSLTSHDRNFSILCNYRDNNLGEPRQVAETIRFLLEGYIRVKYPNYFPPASLLGNFVARARQSLGQPTQIMDTGKLTELAELVDYANRFHHETNPTWRTEVINDRALLGYVRRSLCYIQG
jgi:wobble nucleotide-excising tRNase